MNLVWGYGDSMIDLGSLAGLHPHNHQLAAYAPAATAGA